MKPTLVARLAAMPPRQLNLILGGAAAIVLALFWSLCLRAPLAALRAQQVERLQLGATVADPARARLLHTELARQVAALEQSAGQQRFSGSTEQVQLRAVADIERTAQAGGIELHSAAPGPVRKVAGLREAPVLVEAAGSYAALVAWMGELEALHPPLAIVSFNMRAGEGRGQRLIKLRLAAYLPQEANR